jgi:hypothetical protein
MVAYPSAEHVLTRRKVLDEIRALVVEEIERLETEIVRTAEAEERGQAVNSSFFIHLDGQLAAYIHLRQRLDALTLKEDK